MNPSMPEDELILLKKELGTWSLLDELSETPIVDPSKTNRTFFKAIDEYSRRSDNDLHR